VARLTLAPAAIVTGRAPGARRRPVGDATIGDHHGIHLRFTTVRRRVGPHVR
jgi:hypothetical protein